MKLLVQRLLLDAKMGIMNERIAVDPNIHFGKPFVAGTRITVQDVLELINAGLSFDQIKQDYYPDLSTEDIKSCIDYAIALVSAEDLVIA